MQRTHMMWLIKTLWYSSKALCRKPNLFLKAGEFVFVIVVLLFLANVFARNFDNYLICVCLKLIWIPLLLLFLVLRHGEIIKRRRLNRFFRRIRLYGFDRKLPEYQYTVRLNQYIKKVRFKSRIHISQWEKKKHFMEMYFERIILKMENQQDDMRIMDIFFIEEKLPEYILWNDNYLQNGRKFAIGEGYMGQVIWNASELPHGLVAGSTGTGKSALIRSIIHQAIKKRFNVNVLDFKAAGDFEFIKREYGQYYDLEDGYGPIVIHEPESARELLLGLICEVRLRLDEFRKAEVSNIDEYNSRGREQLLPWLIVIDEAAEILDVKPKDKVEKELYAEIDSSLRTLARISRAAGVSILMGVIRPSHDVLDGQIKNNLLWRVCGYFADPAASRIVLDNDRATELPPEIKGRFIIGLEDEVQAYYLPIPVVADEKTPFMPKL